MKWARYLGENATLEWYFQKLREIASKIFLTASYILKLQFDLRTIETDISDNLHGFWIIK